MLLQLQVWWERLLDTEPMLRIAGTPDPPEAPGSDEWRGMYVRLRTFGSPEVADLYDEIVTQLNAFFFQAAELRRVIDGRGRSASRGKRPRRNANR